MTPSLILPAVVDDATARAAALRLRMLGRVRVLAVATHPKAPDAVTVTFEKAKARVRR